MAVYRAQAIAAVRAITGGRPLYVLPRLLRKATTLRPFCIQCSTWTLKVSFMSRITPNQRVCRLGGKTTFPSFTFGMFFFHLRVKNYTFVFSGEKGEPRLSPAPMSLGKFALALVLHSSGDFPVYREAMLSA